jgi:hypothetical protein
MTILMPEPKKIVLPGPKVAGWFKMEAVRPDGSKRLLADWFPNLVVDTGLNRIGTGSYMSACHVGNGNATPNVLDTSLDGFMAGTTTVQASSYGAQSTVPYYGWKTITYRFGLGTVVGNVAEVGIATSASPAAILFSRALVLDEFGAPTTVTVLADEVLDVTYQLRLYPDLVDRTGSIVVTGSGTHTYVLRAAVVTSSSWGAYLGGVASFTHQNNTFRVYNGAIGAVTSSPAGSGSSTSMSNAGYSNNSYVRQGTAGYGLNYGNLAGGIKSILFDTTLGYYQAELTPNIDKTAIKTLVMTVQISWGRNV